jgi:hypothetical protein
LILFYLVFQVNYMSLAENWNGKGKNHTELANDRSTPAIVRPDERAPARAQTNVRQPAPRRTCASPRPVECALGERSPKPAIVRTRGQQTRQARGQLVFGNFKAPR